MFCTVVICDMFLLCCVVLCVLLCVVNADGMSFFVCCWGVMFCIVVMCYVSVMFFVLFVVVVCSGCLCWDFILCVYFVWSPVVSAEFLSVCGCLDSPMIDCVVEWCWEVWRLCTLRVFLFCEIKR
jgi:hypothetical protein